MYHTKEVETKLLSGSLEKSEHKSDQLKDEDANGSALSAPVPVVINRLEVQDAPPDHLLYSVIVTLFCCWPIGIFAIMKSINCRDATSRGDMDRAYRYSREARKLGHFTLTVGIVFFIISVIICIAAYAFWVIPMHRQSKQELAHVSGYDK